MEYALKTSFGPKFHRFDLKNLGGSDEILVEEGGSEVFVGEIRTRFQAHTVLIGVTNMYV